MSNWEHSKNDGWTEINYDFGLKDDEAVKLSALLNEACHVFYGHAEGVWVSSDKDAYATSVLNFITKHPELESRLLRSKDRIIKMLTYRALELR